DYFAKLRVQPASHRGSPIYSVNPFTPCRRPYPGGPNDCTQRCLHRCFCLRRISTGSTTTDPTTPNQVGSVTRLQRSLHATVLRGPFRRFRFGQRAFEVTVEFLARGFALDRRT